MGALRSAVDELRSEDLSDVPDVRLESDLVELRRVGEADGRRLFRRDGFSSTTALLRHRCVMSAGSARRSVEFSHQLGVMPGVAEAVVAGMVSLGQAKVLGRAAFRHPGEFSALEEMLVAQAGSLSVWELWKVTEYWCQSLEGPGHLDEVWGERFLHVSRTLGGMVRIDGLLPPEPGELLRTALRSLDDRDLQQRQAGAEDPRTAGQRRADSLGEVCGFFLDQRGVGTGKERPHLSVLVSVDALVGAWGGVSELESGEVLHPETVRRLACDATLGRVVLDAGGRVLDVGRRTRVVSSALRRAVVVRDRHCVFPGCDRPAPWCDAHHVIFWADGGATDMGNLALLCRYHHTLVHEGGFRLGHDGEGGLVFTRPDRSLLHHRAPP